MYFVLNADLRYAGPLFLFLISTIMLLRRHGRSKSRHDFERKFPVVIFQPERVARNLKINSVLVPRWLHIFAIVFAIWMTIDAKASGSFTILLENTPHWLSTTNWLIFFTTINLLGIWGLYGVFTHTAFRRRFKRPANKKEVAENIDWFDGLDTGDPPVT